MRPIFFLVLTMVVGFAVLGVGGQVLDRVSFWGLAGIGRQAAAAWWRQTGRFPRVVHRSYWSVPDMERDRRAMARMDYVVVDAAPVERLPQEAALEGRMSRHARRIPVASVVYERSRGAASAGGQG